MPNHVYGNLRTVVPTKSRVDRRVWVEQELTAAGYTDIKWKKRQLLLSRGNEDYFVCCWAMKDGVRHYFCDDLLFGYNYYVVNEEDN